MYKLISFEALRAIYKFRSEILERSVLPDRATNTAPVAITARVETTVSVARILITIRWIKGVRFKPTNSYFDEIGS